MNKEFIAEPYNFDSNQELIELLNKIFDPWPGGEDYFIWKYQSYPSEFTSFPLAWVIKDNDKIIAFNGYFPRKIKIKGEEIIAVQSFDTITHPGYRGKNLFAILQNKVYEGMRNHNVPWVYGWGNENSVRLFLNKVNWNIWGEQCFLLKILNEKDFISKKYSNPITNKTALMFLKFNNKIHKIKQKSGYKIKEIGNEGFSIDINDMMNDVYKNFDLIAERDDKYLNWSISNPTKDYLVFGSYLNDNIDGYIILSKNKQKDSLEIIDCLGNSDKSILSLLYHIENIAKREKIDLISYRINTNNPYNRIFKKAGYIQSKSKLKIIGKNIMDSKINAILNKEKNNIHWSQLDRNE